MHLSNILGLLALASVASTQEPQKLGDVFTVDMRPYPANWGSCNRPRDPNNPMSPAIFNPNSDLQDPGGNILNKIWYDVNQMLVITQQAITTSSYNNNFDQRKLLDSFFGIKSNPDHEGGDHEPKDGTIDLEKLEEVRDRYNAVTNLIWNGKHSLLKLFCGSAHLKYQYGTEPARDINGNKRIKDRATNEFWSIRDWEDTNGRNFDDHWYFYTSYGNSPGESGYLVLSKSLWPPIPQNIGVRVYNFPFLWDDQAGTPSLCKNPSLLAAVLMSDGPTIPEDTEGHDSMLWDAFVVLCAPDAFSQNQGRDTIPTAEQPEGTHLDSLETTSLTLLHEMFHLANYQDSFDQKPFRPMKDVTRNPVRDWPTKKSAFDLSRQANDGNAYRALQCMSLQLYDTADPATADIDEVTAVRNPETFAWFAFATTLREITGQDYSSGAARAPGQPYVGITAAVPGNKRSEPTDLPRLALNDTDWWRWSPVLEGIAAF